MNAKDELFNNLVNENVLLLSNQMKRYLQRGNERNPTEIKINSLKIELEEATNER